MRTFIYGTLLTLLAQPVWAFDTEDLLRYCSKWKEIAYAPSFKIDEDGTKIAFCMGYMSALRDVGGQHCYWENIDFPAGLQWDASTEQLAQHFLNQTEKSPERWKSNTYNFVAESPTGYIFPCKE